MIYNCLPIGTELRASGRIFEITGVQEIESAFIVYSARCYHDSIYMESKDIFEEILIIELFIQGKDKRGYDRKQRISSCHVIDGIITSDFYNRIQKLTNLSLRQVIESFCSLTDSDFFENNNTQYFVVHKNTNTKMRLGSRITYKNTVYETIDICGRESYSEVLKMKRIKHPIIKRFAYIIGKGDWTKNQYIFIKQFCYEDVQSKRKEVLTRNQALKLFKSEYDTFYSLNNSGNVKVYLYVEDDCVPYYVMENIDGFRWQST